MNALAPGWNPDPTGRHEYRYWDGGRWTDDVSDNGVTAVDAMASDQTWTQYPQTAQHPPTTQYPPTTGYPPTAQGPPTGDYPPPGQGPPSGGFPPPGQGPPTSPYPPVDAGGPSGSWGGGPPAPYPSPSGRSGPSPGLLVGLAALAVAVIGGIAYLLIHDDGDDTATDSASQTEEAPDQSTDDGDDTEITLPADPGDATTVPDDEGTDEGSGGGSDPGGTDDDENQVFVDTLADALESTGMYTHEQAVCAAEVMLDQIGVDRMSDMDPDDPFADLSPEETQDLMTSLVDCGFTVPEDGGST